MATGGGNCSHSIGSEDFCDIVCDPCQEDGELHKAVGMCIECRDHLCQKCYDAHKFARPFRKHELLDREAMLQSEVYITKDKCTEKCDVHEDKIIEYYCINHNQLGCSACIILDHRKCDDSVKYIPHVANDLDNNEEYQQADGQLISVVERSKQVTERIKQKSESIKEDCSEAVKMVRKIRKDVNDVLDKAECDFLQQYETIESEETEKIAHIVDTLKTTETDMNALMNLKETYQTNNQNCNLYTLMMKTQYKVKLAEAMLKEAEDKQSHIIDQIKFVANKETLNTMKLPETLGKLLISGTSRASRSEQTKNIEIQKEQSTSVKKAEAKRKVRAEYVQDIDVQYKPDRYTSGIIGLVILPDNRLVIIDNGNASVKLVDIEHSQIITCLTLSSAPYGVTKVTNCQVAITMPEQRKVAIVNVTATAVTLYKTLEVLGKCKGVDHSDGKLAISFCNPHTVQVITLQGRVLHSITTDQQGHTLFNNPYYVVFCQDNNSLYVSNYSSHNVVKVKFDGTVEGIYADSELSSPRVLITDSSGHVYICGYRSDNIHKITPDCKKVQVLLSRTDGLWLPQSISYNETDCMLYVGMYSNNAVKEYRVILG